MIIACPSCRSTFNLDDELVPDEGRKVRCSVCETVFDAKPEGAPPPPEPEGADDSFDDDDDDLLSGLGDAIEDEIDDSGDDFGADDDDDGDDLSLDLDSAGSKPKKKKSKGSGKGRGKLIAMIAGALVLVCGIGVGAVWFLAPGMLGMGGEEMESAETQGGDQAMDMAEQVKKISLESIKQYYVENDKAGRLFVIQGRAVNLFETPKELIEVEASLYDADNNVLDTRRIKAGNVLDLFQLQVLGKDEIETALSNEAGIGSNNINIQPGNHVPFMIVFFTPPDTLAEFNVRVVAARNVDL